MSPNGNGLYQGVMSLGVNAPSSSLATAASVCAKSASAVRSLPSATVACLLTSVARATDACALVLSAWFANLACAVLDVPGAVHGRVGTTLLATLAVMLASDALGAYAAGHLRDHRRRLRTLAIAMAVAMLVGAVYLLLISRLSAAMQLWLLFWGLSACILGGLAACANAFMARSLTASGRLSRRVAIVGRSDYSRAVIARMAADPGRDASIVGLYDDAAGLGGIDDLLARSRRERIDAIVLALPLSDPARIRSASLAVRGIASDVYVASEPFELACKTAGVDRIAGCAVLKIRGQPLSESQILLKAAFDHVAAAILVVLLLPVFSIIAIAIRMDSPGPVIFRQPRVGLNNATFDVFKFRSMFHAMADVNVERQATRGDARITRVGRILRKFSLDELPQLFNVLRGEMSLVGPRPHAPNTRAGNQLFHDAVADYALRHRVKPGITGWAQANGWRGETRTREQLEQRIAHDLHYIDNWSFTLDMKILLLTILREISSDVAF